MDIILLRDGLGTEMDAIFARTKVVEKVVWCRPAPKGAIVEDLSIVVELTDHDVGGGFVAVIDQLSAETGKSSQLHGAFCLPQQA